VRGVLLPERHCAETRFGYDDSLDVFGLHGIGGMIGAVLTGVFCVPSLGGLVEGVSMGAQVVAQIKGVLLTTVYTSPSAGSFSSCDQRRHRLACR
jgi:ammonia channel protein AmtB